MLFKVIICGLVINSIRLVFSFWCLLIEHSLVIVLYFNCCTLGIQSTGFHAMIRCFSFRVMFLW